MTYKFGNKRVNQTLEKYDGKLEKLDEPLYFDAYNKKIREDGIHGTILYGIDFRNMHFIIEPVGGGTNRLTINTLRYSMQPIIMYSAA